jgi:hypothetical protein
MSKEEKKEKSALKKIYVNEKTLITLFSYKYSNKFRNMDEVINDLLAKANKNSSR